MKCGLKQYLSKKGFTLAEVLIVVAIIAVLAAISIPIFTSQIKQTRRQSDIDFYNSACHSAISAFYATPVESREGTLTYVYDASTGMVHEYTNNMSYIPEGYGVSSASDWNDLIFGMGDKFPCTDEGQSGFVVIQFINGDMNAWWDTNPNITSGEATPSTSGQPITQLELLEE